jgi:hypothetical protein
LLDHVDWEAAALKRELIHKTVAPQGLPRSQSRDKLALD